MSKQRTKAQVHAGCMIVGKSFTSLSLSCLLWRMMDQDPLQRVVEGSDDTMLVRSLAVSCWALSQHRLPLPSFRLQVFEGKKRVVWGIANDRAASLPVTSLSTCITCWCHRKGTVSGRQLWYTKGTRDKGRLRFTERAISVTHTFVCMDRAFLSIRNVTCN